MGVYDGSLQTYGAPRVQLELAEEHELRVGRKRVARLMRELAIQGVSRRGKRPRTTIVDEKQPPAPDLVQRRFVADRPDRLWLADITYVPTLEGFLFLGVVMDMYSRKIVGWSMSERIDSRLVGDALEDAAPGITRRIRSELRRRLLDPCEARDDFWHRKYTEDETGHAVRIPSGAAVAVEERPAGGGGDDEHGGEGHGDGHGIHMPSPSYFPFILALGLPILGYAAVFQALWLVPIGALVVAFGLYAWGIEPQTEP